MARPKSGKDWKISSFSLDIQSKSTLKEIAEFQGLSQSDMIGFLAKNWDAGINPANRLGILLEERKVANKKVEEIDEDIEKLTKQIKLFESWNKTKHASKATAIRILKRKILNREYGEAEVAAKYWQSQTGITAIELITEASEILQKSGI